MRLRGYIGIGMALALAVAFGLAVYLTTRGEHIERGALNAAELRWARAYAGWTAATRSRLTTAYLASTGATQTGQVEHALARVAGCRSSYDAKVGEAPERLRPVEASALHACTEVGRALVSFRRHHTVADPQRS